MKTNEKNYCLIVGSPIDYDELVVYVDINDKNIGLLQKEEGIDKLKFEFFSRKDETTIEFDVLLEALERAKEALLK